MWFSRAPNRDEEDRYLELTTDRLRGLDGAVRASSDDPDQIRARLERMSHGASRHPRPSASPA